MKKPLLGLMVVGLLIAADEKKPDDIKDKLKGTWTFVSMETDGKKVPAEAIKGATLTIDADKITHEQNGKKEPATYKLDASQKPAHLDLTSSEGPDKGKTMKMIVQLDGDTLKLAAGKGSDSPRPKGFEGKDVMVMTLKREKK